MKEQVVFNSRQGGGVRIKGLSSSRAKVGAKDTKDRREMRAVTGRPSHPTKESRRRTEGPFPLAHKGSRGDEAD